MRVEQWGRSEHHLHRQMWPAGAQPLKVELLQSRWGTLRERQENVAQGNATGMVCLGLQWVVFWFQQYFENQNIVHNSKRLQKPKDKSEFHMFLQY